LGGAPGLERLLDALEPEAEFIETRLDRER
jgi:hypothetical protein